MRIQANRMTGISASLIIPVIPDAAQPADWLQTQPG
jgi:hypothetical protein